MSTESLTVQQLQYPIDHKEAMDYGELLQGEFAVIPGVSADESVRMVLGNPANSVKAMNDTMSNRFACYYMLRQGITSLAAMKSGPEHYGDRHDRSRFTRRIGAVAHRAGLVSDRTLQIFGYGANQEELGARGISDQEAFEMLVDASRLANPAAVNLSVFADVRDKRMLERMMGLSPTNYRIGRRTTEIALGSVPGMYHRIVVPLPDRVSK